MASENETVAEVLVKARESIEMICSRRNSGDPYKVDADFVLKVFADRIEAAHGREVAELREFAKFAEEWYCGCTCKTTDEEREYGCCNQCEFGEKLRKVLGRSEG